MFKFLDYYLIDDKKSCYIRKIANIENLCLFIITEPAKADPNQNMGAALRKWAAFEIYYYQNMRIWKRPTIKN